MTSKVKPRICRTNEINIPIDTEECVLWLNPVQSIDDIKNPTRDYAWITPDNTVYVFNGHKIVPIFSTNESHIKWGHVDGDIKDQKDLYEILLKTVNGVKQNGTELPKDLEQKVNVSVPIMHIKVNDTEVEPNNYTVNIDLTTYAKTSDIPTKLSQLSNDTGYVTSETIDVPIQTITVNGNLLTPDEHKNVSINISGGGTDFSYTEVETGEKWVDGTPIYKITKTWSADKPTALAPLEIPHGISDIGFIVDYDAFYIENGAFFKFPTFTATNSGEMVPVYCFVDGTSFSLVSTETNLKQQQPIIYVTIYYTKRGEGEIIQ